MKRILIMLLLLILPVTALAESAEFWTSEDDPYYHSDPSCPGGKVYPISREAAEEFDKTPCPECIGATASTAQADFGIWDPSRDREYLTVGDRLLWANPLYDAEGFTGTTILSAPISAPSNLTPIYSSKTCYLSGLVRGEPEGSEPNGTYYILTKESDEKVSRLLKIDANGGETELLRLAGYHSNLVRAGNSLYFAGDTVCRYDILTGEKTVIYSPATPGSIENVQVWQNRVLFCYTDLTETEYGKTSGLYIANPIGEVKRILPGYVVNYFIDNGVVYAGRNYQSTIGTYSVPVAGGDVTALSENMWEPCRAYPPYLVAWDYSDSFSLTLYLFDCTNGFDPDMSPRYPVPVTLHIVSGYAVWSDGTDDNGIEILYSRPLDEYIESLRESTPGQ